MIEPVEKMAEYATIPILAKPNAGLPELENGVTVYKTGPEEFASCGKTGGGRCVHYRRLLWHDTGAYPCTERSSEGYAGA